MLAGKNVSGDFAVDAGYHFEPTDAADVRSQLPEDWRKGSLVLIKRKDHGGFLTSEFRVGGPGNTRVVSVRTDQSGRFTMWAIRVDPDNR